MSSPPTTAPCTKPESEALVAVDIEETAPRETEVIHRQAEEAAVSRASHFTLMKTWRLWAVGGFLGGFTAILAARLIGAKAPSSSNSSAPVDLHLDARRHHHMAYSRSGLWFGVQAFIVTALGIVLFSVHRQVRLSVDQGPGLYMPFALLCFTLYCAVSLLIVAFECGTLFGWGAYGDETALSLLPAHPPFPTFTCDSNVVFQVPLVHLPRTCSAVGPSPPAVMRKEVDTPPVYTTHSYCRFGKNLSGYLDRKRLGEVTYICKAEEEAVRCGLAELAAKADTVASHTFTLTRLLAALAFCCCAAAVVVADVFSPGWWCDVLAVSFVVPYCLFDREPRRRFRRHMEAILKDTNETDSLVHEGRAWVISCSSASSYPIVSLLSYTPSSYSLAHLSRDGKRFPKALLLILLLFLRGTADDTRRLPVELALDIAGYYRIPFRLKPSFP